MAKKRSGIIVIFIIAVLIALVAYAIHVRSVEKQAREAEPILSKPVAVKSVLAIEGSIQPALTVSGSIAGAKEVLLLAKTQGIIASLGGRTGDKVKKEQLLVTLENNKQQLQAAKAEEQLTAAETALAKVQTDFDRVKELYRQGVLAQADCDNAQYALDNAQTACKLARSDQQLANELLADTVIAAPFSGSIADCFVEEGEIVFPGSQLMTLVDDSQLTVKVNLTAAQLKLVTIGQAGVFTTTVPAGKEFPCVLKSVSSQANPSNRTYTGEFTLSPDAHLDLKPGLFGQVKLATAKIDRLIIPREALLTQNELGEAELFVIREDRAVQTKIKTGESDAQNIAVLTGLQPGDRVVVFGQNRLKEGTAVIEGE